MTTTSTPPSQSKSASTRRQVSSASARDALIAAAIGEFAAKGFAGARVDEIAGVAGVNKQLVYHYFENKQGLYLVALESVYAQIREKEKALSLDAMGPLEAMSELVGFSFDYLAEHPEFISLLTDENRNRGRYILASDRLKTMHSPFIEMLEATLSRGVEAGVFRAEYDAVNLYISMAGVSYFFFSNNHTLSAIFGRSLDAPSALLQRRRHVIAFVLNALRP
ncbi:TetR/AcrR family transcriptional regulator [Corticibacter populi]|uniref:TetR/AcrR family transcriptional regulator n=1 Tax=Corticibacter populi TaxID=1550736 RepID=A0A3M6QV84_9BURK|nr:TetR family transcriptional regulator [Corticibacter populi]RMX06402.1 TetR/AcrR family transcriptional regulator [Corticibacter populi]RZS32053.1 TetR family transcriptional regulator [Corticibacter populi]